jgi:hypothetical protein
MAGESTAGKTRRNWSKTRLARLGRLIAEGQTDAAIADLLGCGRQAIGFQRRARLGVHKPRRRPMRPCPEDFIRLAPTLTADQCRLHYRCSARAVRRWYAETGLCPHRPARVEPPVTVVDAPPPPPERLVPPVPMTLERQAAHHLQRFGPAYACAILTRRERALLPEGGEDRWMIHGRSLTRAEMLKAAAARGFPIDRWMQR